MAQRTLVTAALPYSNGRLHVGHVAGAYLPADIYVRYLRMREAEVLFVCGSDDNGVAALKSAREEGRDVAELTAHYNASQSTAFQGLGVCFDVYGGTHQPGFVRIHERRSQELFLSIAAKGYFEKKKTKQLYDASVGQFLPDRYVVGRCHHEGCGKEGAYGDQCESCGRAIDPLLLIDPKSALSGTRPEPRDTVHWHLKLGALADRLGSWLESKRGSWRPLVVNFALGQIDEGLPERAMTRDLSWGVPVPLDDPDANGKTLYVWFEAPIGYVSFTSALLEQRGEGELAYERWWKDPASAIVHFIGEDNIVFHALTWPAMLLASHDGTSIEGDAGEYRLPTAVVANAFLNERGPAGEMLKLSKSRMASDSPLWLDECLKQFEPDPLRYYLTVIAPEQQRGAFEMSEFVAKSKELSDTLGNFVNRWQSFATNDFARAVPAATLGPEDLEFLAEIARVPEPVGVDLDAFRFKSALSHIMDGFRVCNRYVDQRAPWKTKKTDRAAYASTIHACIQATRTLGTLVTPFLPFTGEKIREALGVAPQAWSWNQATDRIDAGTALGPPPCVLFRKN